MTDDMDKTIISNDEAKASKPEAAAEDKGSKSGLLANKKLIIFGGGGLVLIIVIVFGVMFLLGGDKPVAESEESAKSTKEVTEASSDSHEAEKSDKPEVHKSEDATTPANYLDDFDEFDIADFDEADLEGFDFDLGEDELSAIERISANLEFLDGDPEDTKNKINAKVARMSSEDSLEEINWLEEANQQLEARETAVAAREKAVDKTESEVSKKILIIEQAESTRVAKLAKLYDGMDPRSVAKMMANLDDGTVVSIIARMKQKQASLVLALFSPQRGARLSKKMITIAEN